MTRLTIYLYRFFASHKKIFWSILVASTLVFAFFATRLTFVENILDLLPKTDKTADCEVAFGTIKVKDKVFLELLVPGAGPSELASAMDDFMDRLSAADKDGLVANALYRFDSDDIMNLVYYAEGALPCHLSRDFYEAVDTLLCEAALDSLSAGVIPVELPDVSGYSIVDGHLLAPDNSMALAFLTPSFSSVETIKGREFEKLISTTISGFCKDMPGAEVLYHGAILEGTFNSKQIIKDLVLTVGLSLLLICIIICIAFGSAKTLLFLILPILWGTLFSLASTFWIKGEISLIAMGIGAIVLGVALSYCLHVLTHQKFVPDIEQVLREETRPVCLGCLTTVGAFAGLLLTSSDLLRDFGIFASLALIGTTFFALVFLPQFVKPADSARNERVFDAVNRFNSYPLDRNKTVVVLLLAVIVIASIASRHVGFDNDLSHIGYREPKIVRSERLFNEKVNGTGFSAYYAAHSSDLDSAIIYNRGVRNALDSLKAAGLIKSYSGVDGILVPQEEQGCNIGLWKAYWTPSRVANTDALLRKAADRFCWDTLGFDIPATFDAMVEADFEPQSITESGALPEALMCNFVEQNEAGWLVFTNVLMDRENYKTVSNVMSSLDHIVVLDPFYYTGDMVEIAHNDFNLVLLISSIFVFIVLLLSYRSLLISLIAFAPMALSWYVVQGLMAIFGIQFNLINIMISTFIFGIGVDYSIFVMDGLISKARYSSYRLLVCHKVAIFFSGVTLLIVTGSLLFATHPSVHSIGVCTIIGMTSTILITYALQPLLFRFVVKHPGLRKICLHEK